MKPGETDTDKRTISFDLYNSSGLPASGLAGEGAVAAFATTELQVSYNYGTSYTTAVGTFAHGSDGNYKYTFGLTEVQSSIGEKNVWLRYKATGFRTRVIEVPLRFVDVDTVQSAVVTSVQSGLATGTALATVAGYIDTEVAAIKAKTDNLPADPASQAAVIAAMPAAAPTAAVVRDAILNELLSGHATEGTVGDAIAIAASMLQGNFFMDNVDNTNDNGQTAARIRLFRTATAMASVSAGGTGQGEFATFLLTTTYAGPNKITTHKAVRTA
jgi:hypothetical protein